MAVTTVTTEPAVFNWKVPNPSKWVEGVVLEITQRVLLPPAAGGKKITSNLSIYEADLQKWEEKDEKIAKDLTPIVTLEGEFDDEGSFSVKKSEIFITSSHCCQFELKLFAVNGKQVELKDKDGKNIPKLEAPLPVLDKDEDTWQLDIAFKSSGDYERWQDKLILEVDLSKLLKADKYQDDRFDTDKKPKNPSFISSSFTRTSYDYLYLHCTSAGVDPIADWFNYDKVKKLLSAYNSGPHFIIDREGTIYHTVNTYEVAIHAGTGLSVGGM